MKVLNQGTLELIDHCGDDKRVVDAARVLLPETDDWRGEKDVKLIKYLMDNRHTTPFEHVTFTFYVRAPIFVLRQWMRHRTWSYNEESARYKMMTGDYYTPEPGKIGTQSNKTHQSRNEDANENAESISLIMEQQNAMALVAYQRVLQLGCPRELARTILPVSMFSSMYATVDLWNLIHFLRLRVDPHAQWEIRQYGVAIIEQISTIVPHSLEAAGLIDAESNESR